MSITNAKISTVRNAATLTDSIQVLAFSYLQAAGFKAASKATTDNSSARLMMAALNAQDAAKKALEGGDSRSEGQIRDAELASTLTKAYEAMASQLQLERIKQFGLHSHVELKKGKDGKSKDSYQSLISRAQSSLKRAANKVREGWGAGLTVNFDTIAESEAHPTGVLPETLYKFVERTKEALEAKMGEGSIAQQASTAMGRLAASLHTLLIGNKDAPVTNANENVCALLLDLAGELENACMVGQATDNTDALEAALASLQEFRIEVESSDEDGESAETLPEPEENEPQKLAVNG